MLVMVENDV